MRFRIKGTRATLAPADNTVAAMYLARPDKYEPVVEEPAADDAKRTAKKAKGKPDDTGG